MKQSRFTTGILWLACFLFSVNAIAQISQGGQPVSFLYPDLHSSPLEAVEMPAVDVASLRSLDLVEDLQKDRPHRFGFEHSVQLGLDNAGEWTILPGDDRLWRLRIRSAGANTLNFVFSKFKVPTGGQLFIYSAETHERILGAFTEKNNQREEQLGVSLIKGDDVIIEYYEPSWASFRGKVEVGMVVHGYRLPGELNRPAAANDRAFGDSGNCHNNVHCPISAGWEDEIRSAVTLVNGGAFCSGAMIANTSGDDTPYMLTADHCFGASYPTWVFWFNYEAAGCPNPGAEPVPSSISGSTLRARNAASDFLLLELSSAPTAVHNAFYAGWNRADVAATSGSSIHHPSGDIKKFSTYNTPLTNDAWGGTPANSHWFVQWNSGVTEPGSSGSPLFDENRRIVGQLHGGASFCGAGPGQLNDLYGKFSFSWDWGGSAATRLKEWLDPGGNAPMTQDGYNAVPSGGTYLTATPGNQNVGYGMNTAHFYVSTDATSWSATSNVAWITFPNGSSGGSGDAQTFLPKFATNNTNSSRVGTITITDGGNTTTVTLTQAAVNSYAPGCANDSEPANNARQTAPTIPFGVDKYSMIFNNSDKDWWKIVLTSPSAIELHLDNLPKDFDLQLRRANGNVITTSANGGQAPEHIYRELNAGTFYAYVYGYQNAYSIQQCYRLNISIVNPLVSGGSSDKAFGSGGDEIQVEAVKNELLIFPNPTSGYTDIFIPEAAGPMDVQIVNQLGQTVFEQQQAPVGTLAWDGSRLPVGVYFIRCTGEKMHLSSSVLIER